MRVCVFISIAFVGNVLLIIECECLCVEGTSSLLSLVKTFDSVLAVYEGFCNLKQVCSSEKGGKMINEQFEDFIGFWKVILTVLFLIFRLILG